MQESIHSGEGVIAPSLNIVCVYQPEKSMECGLLHDYFYKEDDR